MFAPSLRPVFPALSLRALLETPKSEASPDARGDDAAATRARRDFIGEMLPRNSDAFRSEQDIQNMMHCFPGRF